MKLTLEGIKERKTQLNKDFATVKKQKENLQSMLTGANVSLYRLQGKFALLDDLEKEIKENLKKPE